MEAALQTLGSKVTFPRHYLLYILLAAVDVLVTASILNGGGREINALAAQVIEWFGGMGMTLYKFTLVAIVLVICEVVARSKPRLGRGLAVTAVLVSLVPPAFAGAQMAGVFVVR